MPNHRIDVAAAVRTAARPRARRSIVIAAATSLAISLTTLAFGQIPSSLSVDVSSSVVPLTEIHRGGPPPQGIPAIGFPGMDGVAPATVDPAFVSQDEASAWLGGREPVILVDLGGQRKVYPLQILMWHEIANDRVGGVPVAVTFCPLCNSALVFDLRVPLDPQGLEALRERAAARGEELDAKPVQADLAASLSDLRHGADVVATVEVGGFGVSGLLYASNLLMFDPVTGTLWSQAIGEGAVGALAGAELVRYGAPIVAFDEAREVAPEAGVMDRPAGFSRRYGTNPYVGYDDVDTPAFLFRGEADDRLLPKQRVVSIDAATPVAYPFSHLSEVGIVHDVVNGRGIVVAWRAGTATALGGSRIASSEDVGTASVFETALNGRELRFEPADDGALRDVQTGTVWDVTGRAVSGPLEGERLTPVIHDQTLWFSWAAFRPDTEIRRP